MNGTSLLVMGILSIICCNVLGPVTWIMSNNALNAGTLPENDRNLANIARILGIIGTVFLVIGCLWTIFGGGLAVLGAMAGGNTTANPALQ